MAKENSTRVSVYMASHVLDEVDAYADRLGLSRSSAITVICHEYFKTEKALEMQDTVKMLCETMGVQA